MNNMTLAILLFIGAVTAAYNDVPEKMMAIFDEAITAAQLVSTAGDLHTMSVMLDAKSVMDKRLPGEKEFISWLAYTFKENNVKNLAVDHWGYPYIYQVSENGKHYRLFSVGPDGRPGTADDMIKTGP